MTTPVRPSLQMHKLNQKYFLGRESNCTDFFPFHLINNMETSLTLSNSVLFSKPDEKHAVSNIFFQQRKYYPRRLHSKYTFQRINSARKLQPYRPPPLRVCRVDKRSS